MSIKNHASFSGRLWRILRYDWPLHFVLFLTNWLPDNIPFLALRGALARFFLGRCGKNLRLGRNTTFYNPSKVYLGDDVYIAYGCWFSADEVIDIGNEAMLGPYCVVVSSTHTSECGSFRRTAGRCAPTRIGAGAWLAAHVTVSAGSVVGTGTSVGANSVVLGELPNHALAAGAPARAVRASTDELSR
ncbi:MAG: acyltransferase [Acidobacteriales bacterium]|nr:acyltransferase [Terriglobales bacterium]